MYEVLPAALAAMLLSQPVVVASEHASSCAPDRAARIVATVRPEIPALAQISDTHGTSVVRVDLSQAGSVEGASIAASSGSSILDQAAIRTVKSMVYESATHACGQIRGSYAVEVEFAR